MTEPQKTKHLVRHEAHYQGPIPLPSHLKQYEDIVPGSADRLIKMAEQTLACETQIRSVEAKTIEYVSKKTIQLEFIGQLMAFIITIGALGVGTFLVITGKSVEGTVLGGIPLTWLVAQFIKKNKN